MASLPRRADDTSCDMMLEIHDEDDDDDNDDDDGGGSDGDVDEEQFRFWEKQTPAFIWVAIEVK